MPEAVGWGRWTLNTPSVECGGKFVTNYIDARSGDILIPANPRPSGKFPLEPRETVHSSVLEVFFLLNDTLIIFV